MCGISGFIDFTKKSTQTHLQAMSKTLVHRGPDGEGLSMFATDTAVIGFAHRRLSIIDLSEAAKQPMQYKHLHITFNGEIYNYQEIKDELLRLGHSFETHSDTEVILHAYDQWGVKAIDKFIGMFAIVIYDQHQQKVFCCRDRAGVKPFFYYQRADVFVCI
jgi:asparagine synthase (glutamine-hydrolysing)